MIIKGGLVFFGKTKKFLTADIRIENGLIAQVDTHLESKVDEAVTDAYGMYITPGLIEAHSHVGMLEESIGWEGDDICENVPISPEVQALDAVNPLDIAFWEALGGGVTTICTGPGSAGVVAGTFTILSNNGSAVVDDMVVVEKAAMKCAFGENPRLSFGKQGKQPNTRASIAAMLRKCIEDAKGYGERKKEADKKGKPFTKDLGMENMLEVLEGKMPIKAHVHRADDICTAIRIAREYNISMTLDHCTEGGLIADYVAKSGFPVIVGPSFGSKSKYELKNKGFYTVPALVNLGVKVAITTDHDVTPQQTLIMLAALAVKAGLSEEAALCCITENPAEILGIAHCKGRILKGMDADIVIWDRHPLDIQAVASKVFVAGKCILSLKA